MAKVSIDIPHGPERAKAYPDVRVFMEAMYEREKGNEAPLQAWVAACDAVKARFPKSKDKRNGR
jgi:hypothetical protein